MHGAEYLLISPNECVDIVHGKPPLLYVLSGGKPGKEKANTIRKEKSSFSEGNLEKKLPLEASNGKLPTAPTQPGECFQAYLYQTIIPHMREVEELTPEIGMKTPRVLLIDPT